MYGIFTYIDVYGKCRQMYHTWMVRSMLIAGTTNHVKAMDLKEKMNVCLSETQSGFHQRRTARSVKRENCQHDVIQTKSTEWGSKLQLLNTLAVDQHDSIHMSFQNISYVSWWCLIYKQQHTPVQLSNCVGLCEQCFPQRCFSNLETNLYSTKSPQQTSGRITNVLTRSSDCAQI